MTEDFCLTPKLETLAWITGIACGLIVGLLTHYLGLDWFISALDVSFAAIYGWLWVWDWYGESKRSCEGK